MKKETTKKLIITIERGSDNYGAWAENVDGIYAAGDTVEEVKKDIDVAIELYKKYNDHIPEIIKDNFEIEYHFDTISFLQYYANIFSKAALSRITGINQKQLGHYASGLKKPRKPQVEKIDKALHQLATDLSQIHLV